MTSKAEADLGVLLAEVYPNLRIITQYHIKHKRTNLYLDWYIPAMHLAFETDGIQHDVQSKFFHRHDLDLLNQKINDRYKEEWCRENGVTLIRFKYNEKVNLDTLLGKIKGINDARHNGPGGDV